MKTKSIFILLAMAMCFSKSYAQFSFGVSPGLSLNTAYLGFKLNKKFIPYVGLQFINAKIKYEYIGYMYNSSSNQIDEYTNTDDISTGILIPNIGLKYLLKQKNKLQPYLNFSIAKPILRGKYKYNDKEDEDAKQIFKNTKMWGIEFGFGTEYFFDENFSIGGEFGMRYLNVKSKYTFTDEVYNPYIGDYEDKEFKEVYKLNINPTYTKFVLNFYF